MACDFGFKLWLLRVKAPDVSTFCAVETMVRDMVFGEEGWEGSAWLSVGPLFCTLKPAYCASQLSLRRLLDARFSKATRCVRYILSGSEKNKYLGEQIGRQMSNAHIVGTPGEHAFCAAHHTVPLLSVQRLTQP
ncbi:unnamed protein product [Effrenium voratum]|uniref:Uncharacterized protein n=1 Tax=Effrenium voratum TaxID=2562239 RepID=A0AA36MLE1_9DINO|nr:unnamed protein product [Effrenium voratum]CAJ1371507.1 unnamed protein product [Effrenium voratum]